MIKKFFDMIKKMNDEEILLFEQGVSNYSMGVDSFRVSCSVIERGHTYYIEYNLEYFNKGKRYLLDEGYFRHNRLEVSISIDRRFPNFLKYVKESPSKFLSYRIKSQHEHTTGLSRYEEFYNEVNDIDEALKNFAVKIPGINDSKEFIDDYKKKSKLIAKAFITTAKLYAEELDKK